MFWAQLDSRHHWLRYFVLIIKCEIFVYTKTEMLATFGLLIYCLYINYILQLILTVWFKLGIRFLTYTIVHTFTKLSPESLFVISIWLRWSIFLRFCIRSNPCHGIRCVTPLPFVSTPQPSQRFTLLSNKVCRVTLYVDADYRKSFASPKQKVTLHNLTYQVILTTTL